MSQLKIHKNAFLSSGKSSRYPAPYKLGEHFLINPAALAEKLTGFWAENRWDMRNNPLGIYPKGRDCYRYINFKCENELLNTELRYACFEKFQSRKWSPRSGNIAAQIHRITRFLNITTPPVKSLLDYPIAEWEIRLGTFLIENKEWQQRWTVKIDAQQKKKRLTRGERCLEIFRVIYRKLEETYDVRSEFERDIWDLSRAGIAINLARSESKLNFTGIKSVWLREAVKKYLRVFIATRSVSGSQKVVAAIACFDRFIIKKELIVSTQQIDRQLLLDYISHLAIVYSDNNMRYSQITTLRTFLEFAARENWLPVPNQRLIHEDDLPHRRKCQPRFIPEFVMKQLENLIPHMKLPFRHLVIVLKETGMRISELCTLKLDCLLEDGEGDYFIRYYQSKLRKDHSIPLSRETAAVIIKQKKAVKDSKINTEYLFPRSNGLPFKANYFNQLLNEFAFDHKVADETGKLWRFQAHQLRHTVGTRMINGGVPQHIVQKFLGHESPEMTARYAQIHDQTLKNSFEEYLSKRGDLIDIAGQTIRTERTETADLTHLKGNFSEQESDLLWFKKNIQPQTLPNGYCGLPVAQSTCQHANACLTCVNFRTDATFLSHHQQQLAETKRLVQISRERGWERQAEMNERVENNLLKIIDRITGETDTTKTDE